MEERTFSTIEEYREWARADAVSRGTTIEDEINGIERDIGCGDYCDLLRELHGINGIHDLSEEELRLLDALRDPVKGKKIMGIITMF